MKLLAIFCLLALPFVPAHAAEKTPEAIAVKWYEAFDRHQPEILDHYLGDEWQDIPSPPNTPPGPLGARQTMAGLYRAFPDFRIEIRQIVSEGNMIVVRSAITGTHRGLFMGHGGTGRQLSIQAVDIHEVRDGKIARTWHTEDWMTGLLQLGLVPGKAP